MRVRLPRATVALLTAVAVAALVAAACSSSSSAGNPPAGVPKEIAKVWEAYRTLQERYVDKQALDPKKLSDAAVQAMIAALSDPFSAYLPPERFKDFQQDIEGAFQGIGASVALIDGKVTIVSALPSSPAERAGLRSGDVIVAVDGQPVEGLDLSAVISRIRGPKDTQVKIGIKKAGDGPTVEVAIVREEIRNPSVSVNMVGDGIARVRITQFVASTNTDLVRALSDLVAQDVKGLVIDLRDNPGGLLQVVVDAASNFLSDGLVLYEADAGGKRTDWPVRAGGTATRLPLTVLVNKGSASGSEVFSGAIQDHRRGAIIGTQTFGKGVVNSSFGLSDGSGLYISIAKWFTPSGRQISQLGITPDVLVERTEADRAAGRDPQLDKALEVLRQEMMEKVAVPAAG